MWCNPMMGGMGGVFIPGSNEGELITNVKELVKTLNKGLKDKKQEEKKRKRQKKPRQFSFLETVGLLMILSYPVYFGMEFLRIYLNNLISGIH